MGCGFSIHFIGPLNWIFPPGLAIERPRLTI